MVVPVQQENIGKLQTLIFQMQVFNITIMTSWVLVRVIFQIMNDYGKQIGLLRRWNKYR